MDLDFGYLWPLLVPQAIFDPISWLFILALVLIIVGYKMVFYLFVALLGFFGLAIGLVAGPPIVSFPRLWEGMVVSVLLTAVWLLFEWWRKKQDP